MLTSGLAVNNYPFDLVGANNNACSTLSPFTIKTDYTSNPYGPTIIDSSVIENIPTIFTIISTEVIDSKLINIKYKEVDSKINSLTNSGNIYISSGIFGIYNEFDNFYGKNEIMVEVESEEYIEKIQPGMKFTNATQWEKKLSVEEIINMVNYPLDYYKYIHKTLEKSLKDKTREICILQHREIDRLYGLK